ncbi:MAG TPA: hypothetical protein VES19_04060 [Candidatus Limnocylindrales bacterium]|nr:hypothetical protein [Candidatus Limnocylindrales bacterium]
MIVQTGSTNPRGPLRRGLRALGLLTPLVLLGVIVGAGLLGPKPEPPAPLPSLAAEAPSTAPDGEAQPDDETPPNPLPAFPAVAADLEVLSVPAAQPRLAEANGRPLAVAGLLGSIGTAETCDAAAGDTRRLLSPLCDRSARLLVAGPAGADPGAHIHVRIPAGVRLPSAFERPPGPESMAVVIVGRSEPPGSSCGTSRRGCGERMTADRVMWADGAPFDPGAVFDAGLEVPPAAIAYRRLPDALALAAGWTGTVLVAAAVRPATVAAIDPVAADAMAARPRPEGLVWYVRGLETAHGPRPRPLGEAPPRLSWVVLDETTGETLARGVEDPAGFPSTMAGLPVRDVGTAIARRAAEPAGTVMAVAGWLRASGDPATCRSPIEGLPGAGCTRTGRLVAGPWSDAPGGTLPGTGPILNAIVPPGVAIPDQAVGLPSPDLGPPPPVVAIGRLESPGVFVIESILWVSGRVVTGGRQVAAGLAVSPDDQFAGDAAALREALGGPDTLLRMVLVPGVALGTIDPEAAAGMRAAGLQTGAPLWYLRGLDQATRTVRWAVVEPGTGRVLARDIAG